MTNPTLADLLYAKLWPFLVVPKGLTSEEYQASIKAAINQTIESDAVPWFEQWTTVSPDSPHSRRGAPGPARRGRPGPDTLIPGKK